MWPPVRSDPTSTQAPAVGHETPVTAMRVAPRGSGADWGDQPTPFQRSTSTRCESVPTAMQCRFVGHETEVTVPWIRVKAHVTPFQTCAALGLEQLKRYPGRMAEIQKATDWQAHSVRGFISTAAKKHGLKIESTKSEAGDRIYQIRK